MIDERWRARVVLNEFKVLRERAFLKFLTCLALAYCIAYLPSYDGLTDAARATFFILLFAASLWVTEAIPAFAVAILVMGLEILILGLPGGVYAKKSNDWLQFIAPWSSSVIWLFLGGFILAHAASKSGLDRWMSGVILKRCLGNTKLLLFATMSITFVFSMFVSNTATAAMMIAVVAPLLKSLREGSQLAKMMLLGIAFSANIGGMGTVIGSPPNAIAVGMLESTQPVDFIAWMFVGLPVAIGLFVLAWVYLQFRYNTNVKELEDIRILGDDETEKFMPLWQRVVIIATFSTTVVLWMTGAFHGFPTPVISFIPITVLTITGVLEAEDVRRLPWDVLLLLTGGLSLGVAISNTGLANWLISHYPVTEASPFVVAVILAYLCSLLSNFMSNTAASNILIPMGIALSVGTDMQLQYVLPIALAASSAMCLPVSTPPNAIVYSQGRLTSKDFIFAGLVVGVFAPGVSAFWCWIVV